MNAELESPVILQPLETYILLAFECPKCSPFGRGRSWEHCYKHFATKPDVLNDPGQLDLASLHLAFYLASWGMYRGSTQLLQKDYKIHYDVVKKLFDQKYKSLWHIQLDRLNAYSITLLVSLIEEIRSIYNDKFQSKSTPTDTLVTKVLMGTLGCIIAYDRNVITGLKHSNFSNRLNKESFDKLFQFCNKNENKESFVNMQKKIFQQYGIDYPIMKIIDMYFWAIGNVEDLKKANKKAKLQEFLSNSCHDRNCLKYQGPNQPS